MSPTPLRQKLIIDGYNMLCGAAALEYGLTVNDFHIDLGRLADRIDSMSDVAVRTTAIAIHLGTASVFQDRHRHRLETERTRRWRRDQRVTVHETPLVRTPDGRLQEADVDGDVGRDLIDSQLSGEFDRIVLFTADQDLYPWADEAFVRCGRGTSRTRIELARWAGQHGLRLPGRQPWIHYLSYEQFLSVSTRTTNTEVA